MSRTLHHSKFNNHLAKGKNKFHSMRRRYLRAIKMEEMYIQTPISQNFSSTDRLARS
jgi:hypothetical protein